MKLELFVQDTLLNRTSLQPLKLLTNLNELYLSNNQIKDLQPLKSLTNLEILYLDLL